VNFNGHVSGNYRLISDSAEMEPDVDLDSKIIERSIGREICVAEDGEMLDLYEGRELSIHEIDFNVEPYIGMEFESEEAAMIYYDVYAKHLGFMIRVGNCHRSGHDGSVISRRFLCNKEGFRVNNKKTRNTRSLEVRKPRQITREGCKAMIMVRKEKTGKWVVTKLETKHNHPMGISVGKGRRCTIQARPQVSFKAYIYICVCVCVCTHILMLILISQSLIHRSNFASIIPTRCISTIVVFLICIF
jgi:hypothetical protein